MISKRPPARAALPYGAVMATGGASRLAGPSGLHALTAPLLWLAVAEAVAIALLALLAMWRRAPRGAPANAA